MQRFFFGILALVWFLPASLQAQTLAEKVQEYHLDNGLTLLLVERHLSPTVAAYISFRVGAVNEDSRERGVAHLLEHMRFKGTKTLGTIDYQQEMPLLARIETIGERIDELKNQPGRNSTELEELRLQLKNLQEEHRKLVVKDEFSKIYAENGGVGYNAFTAKDQTTYMINLPANKLELWAAIEADRLSNPVLREFYTERDVVREERRRSYESNPDGLLYETLIATAYKVHPYRNPVIGWGSDIENLSLEETRTFLHKYYSPVNMIVTLVGDIDSGTALSLVQRYFGTLEPGEPVPPVLDQEPPQNGERRVYIDFDAEPQLAIAYHKPTLPQREDYVFDLLMQILGEGRTSRLYQALVVEKQLVSGVGVYGAPGSRYDNLMVLNLSPQQGHSPREVEAAVYAELDRLQQEPVSEADLDKARTQILTANLRRLQGNSGLAGMLSSYQVLGDWHYLVKYEKELSSVTAAELVAVAKKYFTSDNRTVVTLGREDAE